MNEFEKILAIATENIIEEYFSTEIIQADQSNKSVYRERIYCYELYHQIRKQWKSGGGVEFHAEYDKSGSGVYAGTNFSRVKPDFLIHSSGNIDGNFIVMEVKSSSARKSEIKKDIDKLIELTTVYNFKFGVFLIFGKDAKNKGNIANEYIKNRSNIKIFIHDEVGVEASALSNPQASISINSPDV